MMSRGRRKECFRLGGQLRVVRKLSPCSVVLVVQRPALFDGQSRGIDVPSRRHRGTRGSNNCCGARPGSTEHRASFPTQTPLREAPDPRVRHLGTGYLCRLRRLNYTPRSNCVALPQVSLWEGFAPVVNSFQVPHVLWLFWMKCVLALHQHAFLATRCGVTVVHLVRTLVCVRCSG